MVITGLVIDLGYVIYQRSQKKMVVEQKDQTTLFDIILFEKSLSEITGTCEFIYKDEFGLYFKGDRWDSDLECNDRILILHDSFKQSKDTCKILFMKITLLNDKSDLVSIIEYAVPFGNDTLSIVLQKEYSNLVLYNQFIK